VIDIFDRPSIVDGHIHDVRGRDYITCIRAGAERSEQCAPHEGWMAATPIADRPRDLVVTELVDEHT
jgi:hypothetical protein